MPAFVRTVSETAETENIIGLQQVKFLHDPAHRYIIKTKENSDLDFGLLDSVAVFTASKQNQSHPFHDLVKEKITTTEFPTLSELYAIVGILTAPNPEKLKEGNLTRWLTKSETYEALYNRFYITSGDQGKLWEVAGPNPEKW